MQVINDGCTSIISAAFTTIFFTGRKILKTILDVSKANCFLLQGKPPILKHG
jgi:hypothetical protein